MSIYKSSSDEIKELIDAKYPIKLKYNEDLINRVQLRYPYIKKYEISLIIKSFFGVIRDLLITEKIISILPLFTNTQIKAYGHLRSGRKDAMIRIKTNTNKKLK
jgi:hypothetical protein